MVSVTFSDNKTDQLTSLSDPLAPSSALLVGLFTGFLRNYLLSLIATASTTCNGAAQWGRLKAREGASGWRYIQSMYAFTSAYDSIPRFLRSRWKIHERFRNLLCMRIFSNLICFCRNALNFVTEEMKNPAR